MMQKAEPFFCLFEIIFSKKNAVTFETRIGGYKKGTFTE